MRLSKTCKTRKQKNVFLLHDSSAIVHPKAVTLKIAMYQIMNVLIGFVKLGANVKCVAHLDLQKYILYTACYL
jgi:hypothetical protein